MVPKVIEHASIPLSLLQKTLHSWQVTKLDITDISSFISSSLCNMNIIGEC